MDREILFIHVTAREAIVRDASRVLAFILMLGIGVAVESGAMQWVGALFFLLWAVIKARHPSMSIAEARRRLDEIEREGA